MKDVPEPDKPAGSPSPLAGPPAGSGEGSETALQAMIRKRKLRAEDDAPTATDSGDPELSPAQ